MATLGRLINAKTHVHAITGYLVDFLIDTGKLDLTLGCMPGENRKHDLGERHIGSEVESVTDEYLAPISKF
jgi:hypothetical protein